MIPFLFLFLGMALGWFLNARITKGKRVLEIKKLREELAKTASKTSKIQNQVGKINQKHGLKMVGRHSA